MTVTTAPFESVSSTASAAKRDDVIDKPSTSCILLAPAVSTILTFALAAIADDKM